jgi:hypothetical protein
MSFGLGIVTETTGLVDEARREVVQTQCGSTPLNLLAFKLIFKEYNIFFKKGQARILNRISQHQYFSICMHDITES